MDVRVVLVLVALSALAAAYSPSSFTASFLACGGSTSGCTPGRLHYDFPGGDGNRYLIEWSVGVGATTSVREYWRVANIPNSGGSGTSTQRIRHLLCGTTCESETIDATKTFVELFNTGDTVGSVETVGSGRVSCTRYTKVPAPATSDDRAARIIWLSGSKVCLVQLQNGQTWDFTETSNFNSFVDVDVSKFTTFPVTTCPNPTCTMKADFVYVQDQSGSIDATEQQQSKNFAISVCNRLTFGNDGIFMAYVLFNSDATVGFNFVGIRDSAIQGISGRSYAGGGTCIGKGMEKAGDLLLARSVARRNLQSIVFVITDGVSGCSDSNAGTLLTNRLVNNGGVIIIVVGVGNGIDQTKLNQLATVIPNVQTVFTVADFTALSTVLNNIVNVACTTLPGNPCGANCVGFCSCGKTCICPGTCDDPSKKCFDGKCGTQATPPLDPSLGCVYTAKTWPNDPNFNQCRVQNGACDPNTGTFPYIPRVCNDNNACTSNTCNDNTGCFYPNVDCTSIWAASTHGQCVAKVCFPTGTSTVTYQGTDFAASGDTGCSNTRSLNASTSGCRCATFNPSNCAVRACFDVECANVDYAPNSIAPGVPDTNVAAGGCLYKPRQCPTGNPCSTSTCDPGSNSCPAPSPRNCDDNIACTQDSCDPNDNDGDPCQHPFKTVDQCSDGNSCTNDTYECDATKADGFGCRHDPKCTINTAVDGHCVVAGCTISDGACIAGGLPKDCNDELKPGNCDIAQCSETNQPPGCFISTGDVRPDKCGVCGGDGTSCGIKITPGAAAGIAAGILAAIIIAVIIGVALIAAGSGGAVAYYKKYQHKLGDAHDNPMYQENKNMSGENPLYAASS